MPVVSIREFEFILAEIKLERNVVELKAMDMGEGCIEGCGTRKVTRLPGLGMRTACNRDDAIGDHLNE